MTEETTVKIQRKDISDEEGAETTIKLSARMADPEAISTLGMIEEYQGVSERRECGIRRMYYQLEELEAFKDLADHPIVKERNTEDEHPTETIKRLIETADKFMGS